MEQEEIEKLDEVAERWHIGWNELWEAYQNNPHQSLDKTALDIVRGKRERLKELRKKEQHYQLNYEEYVEWVVLESNYA